VVFAFALTIGLDRVAGLFQPVEKQTGLIFPPHVRQAFCTSEFSYHVTTNSLGFRDREFDLRRTEKTRILAIGDSFTFGWGIEADQTWPKVLEQGLEAAGYKVEVANLGRPGGFFFNDTATTEKAIPLLKPDLIILGVLQGDDLAQMGTRALPRCWSRLSRR